MVGEKVNVEVGRSVRTFTVVKIHDWTGTHLGEELASRGWEARSYLLRGKTGSLKMAYRRNGHIQFC